MMTTTDANATGRRILSVSVEGSPLDPARRYRVAVPDFVARGGDGYSALAASPTLVSGEEGPGLMEIVADALERVAGVTADR